jgi:hypothetical protein
VDILSMQAMKDSAQLARACLFSSHTHFLGNCHTTACLSLTTTHMPVSRAVYCHLLGGFEPV